MLVVVALVLGAVRLTVAAPERCAEISADDARATAQAAADWLVDNQKPDGSYLYLADREGNDLGDYNAVRHAGVTLALYQAGETDAADAGLVWMRDRLEERDGWAALTDNGVAPLGGTALMLAALTERREQTGETTYDDTMRDLGEFLVAMQRDNGDFYVYAYPRSGRVDREAISQYFAGEALWAMARLHRALPDEAWRTAAERAAHFIAVERDDTDFVPVAPLNDHWAAYGFAEMADWPLSDDAVEYAHALYGRFAMLIRWDAQADAGEPYATTHTSGKRAAALGTWVEGQAALARLARADDRASDLSKATLASARCGAALLAARQIDGAWYTNGETRMDDQQHAISGLLAVAALLEGEE
ncbi:MAG: hypothetical protein SGJ13_03300 [Actinomycetota bacterium]|nr:hypothetical protein [Actinomycetota bacterium]